MYVSKTLFEILTLTKHIFDPKIKIKVIRLVVQWHFFHFQANISKRAKEMYPQNFLITFPHYHILKNSQIFVGGVFLRIGFSSTYCIKYMVVALLFTRMGKYQHVVEDVCGVQTNATPMIKRKAGKNCQS